jgi:hypothetical protein
VSGGHGQVSGGHGQVSGGHGQQPNFLRIVAFVAAGVALTILVFFALGYAFGRLFL